jgi:small-conductance mechanosensitive channel
VTIKLLHRPLFHVGRHYATVLGPVGFIGFLAARLITARVLLSDAVRRVFSRFKIHTNFVAIVTTTLSLALIVFSTITGVNAAGIPLACTAPLPAINPNLFQMAHSPRRFRSDLNYLIYKRLTAADIEIPNPQRDLHIRSGTLKVENVTNDGRPNSGGLGPP